jgi:hypothetical protein
MKKFLRGPSNMICLFTEIYWRIDEVLLKQFREHYTVILKKSPISIISPIYFELYSWENGKCNCSSEKHLRNLKTNRDSNRTRISHLLKFELYHVNGNPQKILLN